MMRASPILPLLILSFAAAAAAVRTPRDHSGGDRKWLIDGSCKLISVFDGRFPKEYCVTTLMNAPYDDKAKTSLHGLAWISANLLYQNVSATKAKVDQLVQTGPAPARDILKRCSSMYDEAADRVKDALKKMEEKKYSEADRTVSMIQGDGAECEALFRAQTDVVSPLTSENFDTTYLSAMTTLLIRFFDKSYTPWGMPIMKYST